MSCRYGRRSEGGVGCPGRAARQRQERDQRIDVAVLVALGELDAAERRAGELLQTMIDSDQLSLRQAVAWLGDRITIRSATGLLALTHFCDAGNRPGDEAFTRPTTHTS